MLEWMLPKCSLCGKNCNQVALFKVGKVLYCESCLFPKPKKNVTVVTSWNELITPKTFDAFIGQEVIKKELKTMLAATERHGIPVQHILFSGNFGLGKTTIAKIFANTIGENDVVTAMNIKSYDTFPKKPVVVVDEIHTILDEEWLLEVMDKGGQTILGATTTAGHLSGPLRSRFVSLVLQPYTEEELEIIVAGAARNLKYDCPDYVAKEVAMRGKTIARVALFLFKRIYDRITLSDEVTPELLAKWFEEMEIDVDGLDNADRAYINCLSDKPIGLQNLSAMTGFDRITLEETVEPFLLTKGFVKRTPRGRTLGDKKALGIWIS